MKPKHPQPARAMRRAESEITSPAQLDRILDTVPVLFLGLKDTPAPYVVPVCFGWEEDVLFVHSALTGAKMDLLRAEPVVGFSLCTDVTVVPGAAACNFSVRAMSIVGTGRARILTDDNERAHALAIILRHYERSGEAPVFGAGSLSRTCVIAITVLSLRGRQLGQPVSELSKGTDP